MKKINWYLKVLIGLVCIELFIIKLSANIKENFSNNHIEVGFTMKSSRIKTPLDAAKVLQKYSLKNYFNYQQNFNHQSFQFYILWDRDPNEYKTFDLLKWTGQLGVNDTFNLYLGALKINYGQRLLFSTGYPVELSVNNPFKIKESTYHLSQAQTKKIINIDKSGNEIYLNGLAIAIQTNDWTFILGRGIYQYEKELINSGLTNSENKNINYANNFSLSSTYHELPIAPPSQRLSETIYFIQSEKLFGTHSFYQGKVGFSGIFSEFSHPVVPTTTHQFYGQRYLGASLNFTWRPPLHRTSLDQKLLDYWEWFGELALLANEKPQALNHYDPKLRNYLLHLAFSGGLLFRLPFSELILHYRHIPAGYHAPHQMNYTKKSQKNNERGINLGYSLKERSSVKWKWFTDIYQPISHPHNTEIQIEQLLGYTFPFKYFVENTTYLNSTPDNLDYRTTLNHGYQWKIPTDVDYLLHSKITHQIKLVGNLDSNYQPSWLTKISLALNKKRKKNHNKKTMKSWSGSFQIGLTGKTHPDSKAIYNYFYHNRFYNDNLYFNQSALFFLIRSQLIFDDFFKNKTKTKTFTLSSSLGLKTHSNDKNQVFYRHPQSTFFLTFFISFLY